MLVQRQLPDALLGHSHSRLGHRLYSDLSAISDVSRCLTTWYPTPFDTATDTSANGMVLADLSKVQRPSKRRHVHSFVTAHRESNSDACSARAASYCALVMTWWSHSRKYGPFGLS